jgi:E3 ubiquitin-protein ligase UBR4
VELWYTFVVCNPLLYVLRLLTGVSRSHAFIQALIDVSCVPLLHKLEQFSSGNLMGLLAEDLLAALGQDSSSRVLAAVEEVPDQTRFEKKKLAKAMRHKQLVQLCVRAYDKGQQLALVNCDHNSTCAYVEFFITFLIFYFM